MKIPRKSDLINLQEVYKTDDKIAEALGGIPEYLVAYWRRKKGVPPWSEAKFSEQQIRDLWERFGDDFRCGRELNLSKAAYYSWRRKYGILEKPAELKLEQLELRLPGDLLEEEQKKVEKSLGIPRDKPHTSTAKILARAAETWSAAAVKSDWLANFDGSGENAPLVISPGPQLEKPTTDVYAEIPPADAHQPFQLAPWRGDLAWQLIEARAVLPGQCVCVHGERSQTSSHHLGGLGGIGVLVLESSQFANLPKIARIEVTRRIPAESDVEDIILAMIDEGWHKSLAGKILELVGAPIERLTVDRKVKLCASLVTLGAAAAIVTFDDSIRRHYGRILMGRFPQTHPDRTAVYDEEHFLEGRSIEPRVGICENGEWKVVAADDAPASGGVIVGPDALPYEIELCAQLLAERHIGPNDPPVIVCPATMQVYHNAFRKGWAQTIVNAGGSVVDVAMGRGIQKNSNRASAQYGTQLIAASCVLASLQTALARSTQ
jgi:hypothetical protein